MLVCLSFASEIVTLWNVLYNLLWFASQSLLEEQISSFVGASQVGQASFNTKAMPQLPQHMHHPGLALNPVDLIHPSRWQGAPILSFSQPWENSPHLRKASYIASQLFLKHSPNPQGGKHVCLPTENQTTWLTPCAWMVLHYGVHHSCLPAPTPFFLQNLGVSSFHPPFCLGCLLLYFQKGTGSWEQSAEVLHWPM